MTSEKYVGLDVHKATIVAAVQDASGRCLITSVIETKAETIRAFIKGLAGTVRVTLEEGTHASWLFDLIKPGGLWSRSMRRRSCIDYIPPRTTRKSYRPRV